MRRSRQELLPTFPVVNENKAENDECMVLKYQMTDKNLVRFQPHQLKSHHECIMPVATVRCSSPSMNARRFVSDNDEAG